MYMNENVKCAMCNGLVVDGAWIMILWWSGVCCKVERYRLDKQKIERCCCSVAALSPLLLHSTLY